MYLKCKNIYLPDNVVFDGYLKIKNSKIVNIMKDKDDDSEEVIDYEDNLIIPGFIDLHTHGCATGSIFYNNRKKDIEEMIRNLPKTGVTSFLATTGTDKVDFIKEAVKNTCLAMQEKKYLGAECLGVHLEGPFINAEYKGLQLEECCLKPNLDVLKELLSAQINGNEVKLMTLAPELDEGYKVTDWCIDHNIEVDAGHTSAKFDDITEMRKHGIHAVTHMFSAMRGLHHRELGVVGGALYYPEITCEFCKQTGKTVKKEAFELVWRIKGADKIMMCTDCVGLAQVNQEKYHYVRKQTFLPDGDKLIVKNDDGTEYVLNRTNYDDVKDLEMGYLESIQNVLKNVHPTIHEIIKITSENQAKHIHVFNRKGSIEVGKDADLLVLTKDFNLVDIYCLGIKYE